MPRKTAVVIGAKFGRLTVLEAIGKRGTHRVFNCLCDCGEQTKALSYQLTTSSKQSCGCLRVEVARKGQKKRARQPAPTNGQWRGYGEISRTYFNAVRYHAQTHNREFDLTIEWLWELFLKQERRCALSGVELDPPRTIKSRRGNASLDRIDSSKGYVRDNVQWIHKTINKMKSNIPEVEFKKFCKLVAFYE